MTEITRRRSVEAVTFSTADGWSLDGLLYAAERPAASDVVLLHIHGKGATMLDIQARWLPDALRGVAHFAFNMRCHALAYNTDRDDVPVAGGMYESLADGEVDIRAAVEFLRAEGFTRIVMSGHSSGGYYAGVHTPAGDDIVGRILLSPLTDNKVALDWWYPEPGALDEALEKAQALVAAGRPDELIALPSWYWAISARSLLERSATPGSEFWIERVNALPSPVLFGWGGTESRDGLWTEIAERIAPDVSSARIDASDHWYHGYEAEMTDLVAAFVEDITGVDPRPGQ
ncbi:alpha/beta fold hydrolase [Planococcus sp. APC 4015]|nr:alpha/beta fold hydrolase [Planococcus sp. APC 4015]